MDDAVALPLTPSSDNRKEVPSEVVLDVTGAALLRRSFRIRKRRDLQHSLVTDLNAQAALIAKEVAARVQEEHPELSVSVDLGFASGSITWAGVVLVTDVFGRIASNVQFAGYVTKAVRFALNQAVRRRIEPRASIRSMTTEVSVSRSRDPISRFSRTLWWCAGAVPVLLRPYPTEFAKFEGIGGAVLTTGVLAFFSGAFAMQSVFESSPNVVVISIVLGLVWAAAIFNIDRYLVSSLRKPYPPRAGIRGITNNLIPALPRLLMATVIGITISKPLELRLFDSSVTSRVLIAQDHDIAAKGATADSVYAPRRAAIASERAGMNVAKEAAHARMLYLEDEARKEADGTGGSRRYGRSTVSRQKEANAATARNDFATLQRDLSGREAELKAEDDAIVAHVRNETNLFARGLRKDFLSRLVALLELADASTAVWWASHFIVLLLIAIEMTPVIVKFMSPLGPYDVRVATLSEAVYSELTARRDAAIAISTYHFARVVEVEKAGDDILFNVRRQLVEEQLHRTASNYRSAHAAGHATTGEQFVAGVRSDVFTNRTP